jgi:molecular chaperone GrpE
VTEQSRPTGADLPASAADPPANGKPAADAAHAPPGSERVVIRDRRKIKMGTKADKPTETPPAEPVAGEPVAGSAADPVETVETAEAAGPASTDAAEATTVEVSAPAGLGAELESLRAALDERTKDLQRLSAEYANYRKRIDRDRTLVVEQAIGSVLGALLPVLDDLDRARDHDDLVGPFAAVAEQLVNALTKFGLNAFGAKGDPFDPTRHEAVAHLTSVEVTEPTCIEILRRGYLMGERLLRPAMVAVADPAPSEPEQ